MVRYSVCLFLDEHAFVLIHSVVVPLPLLAKDVSLLLDLPVHLAAQVEQFLLELVLEIV